MRNNSSPTLRYRFEHALFRTVEVLIGGLSWSRTLALGRGIGRIFRILDARHRRVVRENLRNAGLGLDEAKIQEISRACFEHFGSLLFATVRMLRMSDDEIRSIVRMEGLEHFDAATAEGKGVVAITGHFGNWELLALGLSMEGRHVHVIGRELDNPLLEEHLRGLRTRFGNAVIPKDGAVRESLKMLKQKKVLGFLLDQDGLGMGVFVRFFGCWASTFPTAGMLATRYDLPVLPISSHVDRDGVTTVRVHAPFHIIRSGDPQKDAWMGTQMMTAWTEALIRRDPAQWFWMHRRFKTQPGPGAPPLPSEEWLMEFKGLWSEYRAADGE